jgi:hypothetical protein
VVRFIRETIMSSPLQHRLPALAAILALAGACSDSTRPSNDPPADLTQVLAELQPSSLAPLNGAISVVPVMDVGAPVPSSCSYDGTSKSFLCPSVSVGDITLSRSFTLLDASGAPQTTFDKTTTAAVRMRSTFVGTVTAGATSMVMDQEQELTLSGLLTGVHTLNGTSLGHMSGTVAGGPAPIPISTTISTTITNLVLPRSSSGSRWPLSGTVAASMTDAGFVTPVTTTITIGFNGTSTVTVTLSTNGFTSTSTVDLANPGSFRG